ncbi:MAG: ABC transporter permease, partial [Acidobacteria bacterium]|nr:ABC transporter permease [Acidobacteriota bacterium]
MFWRLVRESVWRPGSRRRSLWAVLAVALGTAVAAAMLNVSLDVGDKVGQELRSLGANIVITPAADSLPVEIGGIDYRPVSEGSYIAESSLGKLKEIFWRNNIVSFAPFLYLPARVLAVQNLRGDASRSESRSITLVGTWFDHPFTTSDGEQFRTGVRSLNPTWKVDGEWMEDSDGSAAGPFCLVGRALAESLGLKPGDTLTVAAEKAEGTENAEASLLLQVKGVLTTGAAEDDQIVVSLATAQSLAGLPDKARKVEVSALIKPEDEFSRRDPSAMTPEEYDRWYCSPYISSLIHQIGEVLPAATAQQVRQVAETQGNVLGKLGFLMGMLALLALLAAALSISSLASLAVVERRQEIGLMKALGAPDGLVSSLFVAEAMGQGIAGGLFGFLAGQFLARLLGRAVFGSEVAIHWLLLPVILLVALALSLAGTW